MPSITRVLKDDVLRFGLDEETFRVARTGPHVRTGRSARTLVKDGPLRVTLVTLGAGEKISEHTAAGPITVLPLQGQIAMHVKDEIYLLGPGELLSLGAAVPHSVESEHGGVFLLTVATYMAPEEQPRAESDDGTSDAPAS